MPSIVGNRIAAINIPQSAFFELYPVIRELAEVKARELGVLFNFDPTQYCWLMQHCWNAMILQDYPNDFDDGVADYLEGIIANYDLIHLDEFVERTLKLFPTDRRYVQLKTVYADQTLWQVTL